MIRLDTFLARASIGRKKAVRTKIIAGEVMVNGELMIEPAYIIDEDNDVVTYQQTVIPKNEPVYYMFHKPYGCITARKDNDHATVMDYFTESDRKGIFPVGRLDIDTEGILLFTNDGEFEHALMHPDCHVEKKYYFIALGELNEKKVHQVENGMLLTGEEEITKDAKLFVDRQMTMDELKKESTIELLNKIKTPKNPRNQVVTCGYLTLSEGRKHQVKRMLKAVGCYVIYLKRVQIGSLVLDKNLDLGQYRKLTKEELELLRNDVKQEAL